MFTSKKTHGFYDAAIHACMPDDAIEISVGRHVELMAGQSVGKIITWRDDGFPVLVDPPPPSAEELSVAERNWRDVQLAVTDDVVSRHRDELEDQSKTTLTAKQYSELQAYRRALRNWPEAGEFPLSEHRPPAPIWLSTLLQ